MVVEFGDCRSAWSRSGMGDTGDLLQLMTLTWVLKGERTFVSPSLPAQVWEIKSRICDPCSLLTIPLVMKRLLVEL